MSKTVSQEYLDGILDGRRVLRTLEAEESPNPVSLELMQAENDNCARTARLFDAQSPVGQLLRGERDFWRNQIKRAQVTA